MSKIPRGSKKPLSADFIKAKAVFEEFLDESKLTSVEKGRYMEEFNVFQKEILTRTSGFYQLLADYIKMAEKVWLMYLLFYVAFEVFLNISL